MKIKELPDLERPYEKLENYGPEVLSIAELLAIIIKNGTKELTSIQIAQCLLNLDEEKKGISFFKDISLEELQKQKGIGRVKAIQLKALAELVCRGKESIGIKKLKIETPEDVSKIFMMEMRNLKQETTKTILLDSKNQIIRVVTNSLGTISFSYIEPRDIFREPLKSGAAKIIIIHNHPSGDPTPSKSDIHFTKTIQELGEMFNIELVDHIIIGDGTIYSFKRSNKIM